MQIGKKIRNFGFIAHIDAGKTTTTERVLFLTGSNYRIGEVDEGTTTTDWMLEEKERGITIVSAAVSCQWNGHQLHIIDTPGHVDFIAEVHRSLRVLDGVVVVFCGVSGVQTQSEAVWKEADKFKIPRIAYINKLDRIGADFDNAVNEIQIKLKANPLPITVPVYEEDSLIAIVDLINMQCWTFLEDGKIDQSQPIPDSFQEKASHYRENLINILTENDDSLLEAVLEEKVTSELLQKSIRQGAINLKFIPVLAGSSFKNIGVPLLIDAIVDFLPSPIEAPAIEAYHHQKEQSVLVKYQPEDPPLLYVFKLQFNKEMGPLSFARIYHGTIKTGMTIHNIRSKKEERILSILKIYGDKFERLDQAEAGDIVILVGMKETTTGDTLGIINNKLSLENLYFPEPVIFMKVEPRNAVDQNKFITARQNLMLEDPTLTYKEDNETGETLIGGMGELHLEIFLERVKSEYKIDINSGNPQVAHRETPKDLGQLTHLFESKIGGNTNHVEIDISIEPKERNSGVNLQSNLSAKQYTQDIIESAKKGIYNALISGPEGAYPVIDCSISINDLTFDDAKNAVLAVEAAASICTTNLLRQIGMDLLEPLMRLEITQPESFTGAVIGDLQSRNGIILDIIKKHEQDLVIAKAPLKNLFGYATGLRSITQGKGNFTMKFFEYDKVDT
ncbi:MAG: elongation factor G [Spirochaetes bacterium]|nr:elongation factor G [Spirochaetota bacterium]